MSPYKENAMMKAVVSKLHISIMLMELEYRLDKLQYSYVENSMGSYSAEELAHMDRLRYKPKKTLQKGLDVSAELYSILSQQVENHVFAMNTTLSQTKTIYVSGFEERYRRSSKC
jgi:hypothetical protein